ncbi:hypothetical protein [Selenomonas sp. AE3005]|uniref:hypothetical protein n=1 Tax=Selenomonas sp. AE3005 TaxID=1485543 RepID=UPI0004815A69|nr:hypothetical protein [Selenomonas sp. AE3005]
MMDKKELNMMEMDMVAGGSWIGDVVDFVEDTAKDVWNGVEDVTNEVVEVTWKGMEMVYDAIYPIQE